MGRSLGLAVEFSIFDCGARFTVEDYCYPLLLGSAALVEKEPIAEDLRVDTAGLMAANLRASFYPDLISGTSLGLAFPLLIHLSEIQSGPVYPWSLGGPEEITAPLPYVPSPYRLDAGEFHPQPIPAQGPWQQKPLDRYPCPRPLTS